MVLQKPGRCTGDLQPKPASSIRGTTLDRVPLAIDMARALRSYPELTALAEAVLSAPTSEQETEYLEWKSAFDLRNSAEHRFEVAKHILGFSNRHPDRAAQHFAGSAYLVLGVEPQSAVGLAVEDQADLTKWIGQYTGAAGPQWSSTYVKAHGVDVLVVTVEAPAWGDGFRTLAKGFGNWSPGQLFIRRAGLTVTPDQAEVLMLQERVKRSNTRIAVEVELRDPCRALRTVEATTQDRDNWVNAEGVRLVEAYNRNPNAGQSLAELAASPLTRESRSRTQYEQEMVEYLGQAPTRWRALILKGAIRLGLGAVQLQMTNPTDQNFAAVRVVLEPPENVLVYVDEDDPDSELEPPKPPLRWGEHSIYSSLSPALFRSVRPEAVTHVTTAGSQQQVRFLPINLRPHATESLPPVYLILPRNKTGDEIELRWTATSTSADSFASGTITVQVDKEPVRPGQLIETAVEDDE